MRKMGYDKKGKIWYETWSKELDYRGKNAVRGAVYIRHSKVDLVNLPIYEVL